MAAEKKLKLVLTTADGESVTLEGRGCVAIVVDEMDGDVVRENLLTFGKLNPLDIARKIMSVARDENTGDVADFYRKVIALCRVFIKLDGTKEAAELLGMVTDEEAFARGAIAQARGREGNEVSGDA